MRKVTPKKGNNLDTTGKRIAYHRTQKGLSQEQLAEKLFIKRTMLTMIEKDARPLSVDTLKAIANELELTTDYLLCRTATATIDKEIQDVCGYTGLCEEAVNFLVGAKSAIDFKSGRLNNPNYDITIRHRAERFIDIINNLMRHHEKDVTFVLEIIREYLIALENGNDSRKTFVINIGQHYDLLKEKMGESYKKRGDEDFELKYPKEEYVKRLLDDYNNAIEQGVCAIPLNNWNYFADEHRQVIKEIRSNRYDVEQAILKLIDKFTEREIERLNDNISEGESGDV